MDDISNLLILKIPKNSKMLLNYSQKGIFMAYVSRSCDFWKVKIGRWTTYIIK